MSTEVQCEFEECKWNNSNTCIKDSIVLFASKDLWDGVKPTLVCEDYEEQMYNLRDRNIEIIRPATGRQEINKLKALEDRMRVVLEKLNIQEENYSEEGGKTVKQLVIELGMKKDIVSLTLRLLRGRGKAFVGAKIGERKWTPLWFKTDGEAKYYMK